MNEGVWGFLDIKFASQFSIGLAAILAIIKKIEEHSARLVIGGINPKIQMILQLIDITNQVEIFSSAEKALDSW